MIDAVGSKAVFGDRTDSLCVVDVSTAQVTLKTIPCKTFRCHSLSGMLTFLTDYWMCVQLASFNDLTQSAAITVNLKF
jgi:hypothetical protein